jgi:nitric oxide reductase NorQ protein
VNAPFYLPIADEVELFTAAWQCRLPVLLRGPTGCGKTRFVEHMAATLPADNLVKVACDEDLTGRYLREQLAAHPDSMLVISYNPGSTDLAPSTRQRFVTIDFEYAPLEQEAIIIQREAGVTPEVATALASLGHKVRGLKGSGLEEGVSTRLLVYAARLIQTGVPPRRACDITVARSLTDDHESTAAINELTRAAFK